MATEAIGKPELKCFCGVGGWVQPHCPVHGTPKDQQQPPPINPADIVAQIVVIQTKDQVSVQLPGADGAPDLAQAIGLLGSAMNIIAQIMTQPLPEARRILPVAAIPKEFLTKGNIKL